MKKILALGFLGFAYACTSEQKTAGGCYEDSQEYRVATNKTITNLVLTEIVDIADAESRGYTAADVGKYGISNCEESTDEKKKWGDEVDGNVVECESVYKKANGESNLAPRLVRKLKTLDGPDGGTYHRILLQTNAMCDSISDVDSWCSVANGYNGDLIGNAASTECAGETCSEVVDAATCCQVTCVGGTYNTAAAGEQRDCVDCPANTWNNVENSVSSCTSHTKCVAGKYRSSQGNKNVDSVCDDCQSGKYSNSDITGWDAVLGNTNNDCKTLTTCSDDDGKYQTGAPSATQDRQCGVKACTCTDGEGATGTACPTNGVNKCISCTSADKFLSGGECKEGITGNKFKSLSASKTARSDVAARLNAFYIKLQEKYVEGERSDFQTFNKVELKDTRKSLKVGSSMKYSREKDGETINRKTFGRVKMTRSEARANKIAITKSDGELEKLEFDMEHADDVPDFQSFNFGAFEILCQTTSAITASCANADGPGRRLDQSSCFRGAIATYDATDDVWTFDPGTIEFSHSCAVSEVDSEVDGQYTISQCTGGTYSRDTEWATYSAPLVCSLCPAGSGAVRRHVFGNNGEQHYTYNGLDDPDITIVSGVEHTFERSTSGHSLIIITEVECNRVGCSSGWTTLPISDLDTVSNESPLTWTPTAGIYYYVCSLHPEMYGKITVTANAGECEVCDNDPHPVWNNAFDSSPCGEASTCVSGKGLLAAATETENTQCEDCNANLNNKYSDVDDYTACKDCTPLTCSDIQFEQLCTNTADGQCVDCAVVANSVAGSQRCEAAGAAGITAITCNAGFYKTETAGVIACSQCSGASGSGAGDGWSDQGASECENFITCAAGQKIDDSGSTSTPRTCTLCVSGTYSTTENANSCNTCSGASGSGVGDGWSNQGASKCENFITCDAGQKIDDSGSASTHRTCTPCNSGTYSTTENANSCTTCDANSVGCTGLSEGQCKAGYSGNGASCAQCAIGKFKGDVANGECTDCTNPSPGVVGGYTSEVGQTACKSCSLFSTEWINTQCCSDSTHCGHLLNQCGTSC